MKQITGSSCYITQDGKVLAKDLSERSPKLTLTGYHEISVYFGKDVGRKYFRLHRLVAEYFIPNPENKPFVNHIDGNKTNNCVQNLEWVTHAENMEHAKNFGLVKRAEDHHNSVLSTPQVELVCKLLEQGYRNTEIAKTVNCKAHQVSLIRSRVCWTHISCKYNIPKRSRSLGDSTIKWICQRLVEKKSVKEILEASTNKILTEDIIKDIKRRRIYKDISKEFNF